MRTAPQTIVAEGRREIERVFERIMEKQRAVRGPEKLPAPKPIPTLAERLLKGMPRLKP